MQGEADLFDCHMEGHKVSKCDSMKCCDSAVTSEITATVSGYDIITAPRVLVAKIKCYWVTDTVGTLATSKEGW